MAAVAAAEAAVGAAEAALEAVEAVLAEAVEAVVAEAAALEAAAGAAEVAAAPAVCHGEVAASARSAYAPNFDPPLSLLKKPKRLTTGPLSCAPSMR
jgi:hypothetical protein